MIKVNLLPSDLRTEEFSLKSMGIGVPGVGIIFRNVTIGIVLVLVVVHSALFLVNTASSGTVKELSQKLNRLLPEKKEYAVLRDEVGLSNKKAKAIDDLMANRFIWSKKLNDLSDSIIPGIWLTELTYEEIDAGIDSRSPAGGALVPQDALRLNRKDAMKPPAKKAAIRYLIMSGYASSMGEEGTSLVGKFIKSMKDNPALSSDFSDIKLESIKSDKVQDQEAMSFKITCAFKAGG